MRVQPILMMSLIVGINSCFKEKEDQSKSWIWSSAIGSKHEGTVRKIILVNQNSFAIVTMLL